MVTMKYLFRINGPPVLLSVGKRSRYHADPLFAKYVSRWGTYIGCS
jgi:hypothetical protein